MEADPGASVTSSPRRRRAVQKRVVSVPIGDTDGSKMKGEGAPPSDSWAWRKYGQKPIKGSPYPRGYYRCSSWKGCPARKQVERSHADPTMLMITYACEHNHPWPISRNATPMTEPKPQTEDPAVFSSPVDIERDEKFTDLEPDAELMLVDDFCWFSDLASSPAKETLLLVDSPIYAGSEDDVASMLFPLREEDESLFADLGELPESSAIFRRGFYERADERRRCSLPLCGSTG